MKQKTGVKAKILAGGLCLALGMGAASYAQQAVTVRVNGTALAEEGVLIDGKTYVPLRAVGEALGADVAWDNESKAADVNLDGQTTVTQVVEQVAPSVVGIIVGFNEANSSYQKEFSKGMAIGSGFAVKPGGEIVTNAHVVSGADSIVVVLNDRSTYEAKLKYIDERADIAVVKIDKTDLPALKLADPGQIKIGQTAISVGTPIHFSNLNTSTKGIVSGIVGNSAMYDYRMIKTDASINGGNSGGPLVNMKGEVMGINTMGYADPSIEDVTFAIESDTISYVLSQFEKYGEVRRPRLGATFSESWEAMYGFPAWGKGITVELVDEGSPAQQAGLAPGDKLMAVDGAKCDTIVEFNELLKKYERGQSAQLSVQRNGIVFSADVMFQ